jgi:hypothetical protein
MAEGESMEGIGEGKVLSPEQLERMKAIRDTVARRKRNLLVRLGETEDPEERRAIEEELAKLPTVIVSMRSVPVTELKGGDS